MIDLISRERIGKNFWDSKYPKKKKDRVTSQSWRRNRRYKMGERKHHVIECRLIKTG